MSDIRVIAVWEEDGKSWRERYEELKASCVAMPVPGSDETAVRPFVRRKPFTLLVDRERARAQVEDWNSKYPPGTAVVLTDDLGHFKETATRSRAWIVGAGTPVVKVVGRTGGYLLDRIAPVEATSQPETHITKPDASSGQIEASGEATEPVIISTPDHIGIISRDDYQAIYDAAPCPHCHKLLKSENPENKCRCGE